MTVFSDLCVQVPFNYVELNPLGGETRTPEFKRDVSPVATVPVLHDPANDLQLAESNAILRYLCQREGWLDMYPGATDIKKSAKIDEYLSWHHHGLRKVTINLFRPKMLDAMKIKPLSSEDWNGHQAATAKVLSKFEDVWLQGEDFMFGTDPTIADLQAYCELDQLDPCQLLQVDSLPKLQEWTEKMKALPEHDEVRENLVGLGSYLRKKSKL